MGFGKKNTYTRDSFLSLNAEIYRIVGTCPNNNAKGWRRQCNINLVTVTELFVLNAKGVIGTNCSLYKSPKKFLKQAWLDFLI